MITIQEVEAYWDNRPCNIRHSSAPVGSRQYFEEVEERKYFVEPHIPSFAEFEKWNGKKVLEIGSGIGTDTINFARAGAHVTAIDISFESLTLAKNRASIMGVKDKIKFFHANAEAFIVPGGPFDLIYSFGCLHHTPNPLAAIENLKNFCHPGTVIKLMLYNRISWKVLEMILHYGYSSNFIAKFSEAEFNCPVTYAYTKEEARKHLENSGFEVLSIETDHIFPYNVSFYKRYIYRRKLIWQLLGNRIHQYLEKRFGWHLLITAKPNNKFVESFAHRKNSVLDRHVDSSLPGNENLW